MTEQQALPLVQADGRWGVDWQPTLIFKELKGERLVRFFPDNPIRGRILDRHGTVLAETGEAPIVGVIPADIKDEAALAGRAEPAARDWSRRRSRRSTAAAGPTGSCRSSASPGRRMSRSWSRSRRSPTASRCGCTRSAIYPLSHLACPHRWLRHRGAGRGPGQGLSGRAIGSAAPAWRRAADKELAGERGGRLLIVEKDGTPAVTLAQKKARPGADVTLTLDLKIQRMAEAALGDKRGAVVVLDPEGRRGSGDGQQADLRSQRVHSRLHRRGLGRAQRPEAAAVDEPHHRRPLPARLNLKGRHDGGRHGEAGHAAGSEQFSCAPAASSCRRRRRCWGDWKPGGHGRVQPRPGADHLMRHRLLHDRAAAGCRRR